MLVDEQSHVNPVIAVKSSFVLLRYLEMVQDVIDRERFLSRARELSGVLISSKYAHLSFHDAAVELLEGEADKPPQVSAWLLALLMAQFRPPQREVIGSSPKYCLKRRSGHQAREPPHIAN